MVDKLDWHLRVIIEACNNVGVSYEVKKAKHIILRANGKRVTYDGILNSFVFPGQTEYDLCKKCCTGTLRKHNIPVPNNILYTGQKINLKYPLVVKPAIGYGGMDVHVNIQNEHDLYKIINKVKNKGHEVMVEEFIKGSDHRVLVYKNKVLDIIKRVPPTIIGDGYSTISELVYQYNEKNREMGCEPVAKVDEMVLKRLNYNYDTVLKNNEVLVFNEVTNYHKGARSYHVKLEDVHPDNLNMLGSVNQVMGIDMSGIDFLIKDISVSYKEIGGAINEVNICPYVNAHYMIHDNKTFIIEKLISLIFGIN